MVLIPFSLPIMLESPPEVLATWEVAKSVMTTLSTALVIWMFKMMFAMRDDVRDLKRDVTGADGRNGIKSDVAELRLRVGSLERRNDEIDAAAEALERAQYDGPERRRELRRLRDKLHESHREDER